MEPTNEQSARDWIAQMNQFSEYSTATDGLARAQVYATLAVADAILAAADLLADALGDAAGSSASR